MSLNALKNIIYMLSSDTPPRMAYFYLLNKYVTHRIKKRAARDVIERFSEQTARRQFSEAFFPSSIPNWVHHLRGTFDRNASLEILEIGCWEGMSSLFLVEFFPQARLHAVDTWEGSIEDEHFDSQATIESRFDANLSEHADRIEKNSMTSAQYFINHAGERTFDLIYIDGSHFADDVVLDCTLAFARLKVGGLMIMDDYLWRFYKEKADNPLRAINAFLYMKRGRYELLDVYSQVIIRRTR